MTDQNTCPAKWVPGYCRKPPSKKDDNNIRKRLTAKERQEIENRLEELVPQVTPSAEPTPSIKGRRITKAPHALLDTLTEELRVSLFRMPFFFSGAVTRMLDTKYRKEYPDPRERYTAIKKKFVDTYKVEGIPPLYEFEILKTCLTLG